MHCGLVDGTTPIGQTPFTNAVADGPVCLLCSSAGDSAAPQLLLLHERKTAAVNYSLSHQLMPLELQELISRWFVTLCHRHSHEGNAENFLFVPAPTGFCTREDRMSSDDLSDFTVVFYFPPTNAANKNILPVKSSQIVT